MIVRCHRCDTYFHVDEAAQGERPAQIVCTKCREPVAAPRRRARKAQATAAAGSLGGGSNGGSGGGGIGAPALAAAPTIEIAAAGPGAVRLDPRSIDPALAAVLAPESAEADLFKRLRTRLFLGTQAPPRTIFVTSAIPGEGKTVVAANLAASIARGLDRHALLVDANPRRPRAASAFGLSPARGLLDYLAAPAGADLGTYILKLPIGRLSILPLGEPLPSAPELLASSRMRELVSELADRYDDRCVVIDGSSLQTPEALALAARADGVLLVVRAGKTPSVEVERAKKALAGARLLGTILNDVEATEAR